MKIDRVFFDVFEERIRRRTVFELNHARNRAHTLVGLAIAVANLDEVIKLIRAAPDPNAAREQLMARDWVAADVEPLVMLIDEPGRKVVGGKYRLSEEQAKAILDLRLHRLTGLERDKIHAELREIGAKIAEYLDILRSRERLYGIMRNELQEMKAEYGTPRRTAIEELEFETDIEDLIQREDMVVTVTNTGWIKRVPLSTYRAQRRGGKGRAGMATKEEDFVQALYIVNTHTPVLFFSTQGMVYKLKVYKLPVGTPQSRGKAMINLLPLKEGETISTVMPMPEDESTWEQLNVMFATSAGTVRRNDLSDFVNINRTGKIAMKLEEGGDRLIGVMTCSDQNDVLLSTREGKCIRFAVSDVRVFQSRSSVGVRGIKLAEGDEVISMSVLKHVDFDTDSRDVFLRMAKKLRGGDDAEEAGTDEPAENGGASAKILTDEEFKHFAAGEEFILTATRNGFGKRTSAYEYRITGRGGQGIVSIATTKRNGEIVASFPVADTDQVMMITDAGRLIRIPVADIRVAGRSTQGVTLFTTGEDEHVTSVAHLPLEENGEEQVAESV